MGSGCSTVAERMPLGEKLERLWVQILLGAWLFSTSSLVSFLSHLIVNWEGVINLVPQGGA